MLDDLLESLYMIGMLMRNKDCLDPGKIGVDKLQSELQRTKRTARVHKNSVTAGSDKRRIART